MNEARINAMLNELASQRALLGDRATALAAANAELRAEVERLNARIAELEKPKEPSQ